MRRALEPLHYPFFDYRRFTFSLGITTPLGVWLSGSTAVQFDTDSKRMVVHGDLVEQARLIYRKMATTLQADGLDVANIGRITQYVTPRALKDLPRLMELHRSMFENGAQPSISTVVVRQLLREEALIEVEAFASAAGKSSPVQHLPSVTAATRDEARRLAEGELEAIGRGAKDMLRVMELLSGPAAVDDAQVRFPGVTSTVVVAPSLPDQSHGVQVEIAHSKTEGVVYASAAGDPARGDVVDQTRDAYARIEESLKRSGLSFANVIKTTEFVTREGLGDYRHTADIRRELFQTPYPAATGVICEGLPRPGSQIVVEVIALKEIV